MNDAYKRQTPEQANRIDWDLPEPHSIRLIASADDADGYGHINNSVYLTWLDRCIWDHCDLLGMPPSRCRELQRGFAVVRHEIDYLRSAYPGDEVMVSTWVTGNDGRLRSTRHAQIVRLSDQQTLVRVATEYVCTNLDNGRPARMPAEFARVFDILPAVADALANQTEKR